MHTRRRFVAATLGGTGIGLLAGCPDDDGTEESAAAMELLDENFETLDPFGESGPRLQARRWRAVDPSARFSPFRPDRWVSDGSLAVAT